MRRPPSSGGALERMSVVRDRLGDADADAEEHEGEHHRRDVSAIVDVSAITT